MIDDLSVNPTYTRKTWLAVILALLTPGIACIYNREYVKALLIYGGTLLLYWAYGTLHIGNTFHGLIVMMLIYLLETAFLVTDAIRGARKQRPRADNTERALQVSALLILFSVGILFNPLKWIKITAFTIPSPSGAPTLLQGDRIMASTLSAGDVAQVQRGDVLVFFRNGHYRFYRVIGMPGDHLQMDYRNIYINHTLVPTKLVKKTTSMEGDSVMELEEALPGGVTHPIYRNILYSDSTNPLYNGYPEDHVQMIIPRNAFYLLGDYRDNAMDSRYEGPVPIDSVRGLVRYIFYSPDTKRIGEKISR